MPNSVVGDPDALGLPLNHGPYTWREVFVRERFLISVSCTVLTFFRRFEDGFFAAAQFLFQIHPRTVCRSGNATFPLWFTFA